MFVLFAVNCAAEGTCGMDRDLSTINHMLLSLLNDDLREITNYVLVHSLYLCGHCQLYVVAMLRRKKGRTLHPRAIN